MIQAQSKYIVKNRRLQNNYLVAASALLSSSAYKASAFSEINPVPHIFFHLLKILSIERSSDSQKI